VRIEKFGSNGETLICSVDGRPPIDPLAPVSIGGGGGLLDLAFLTATSLLDAGAVVIS
jgi:hypothetical protein